MAVAPFTLLQEHKGDTAPALASHLSHHINPIQAFAHLHCELPTIQTKHITPPVCVFSFKINSLIFEGQIPPEEIMWEKMSSKRQ